MKNFDFGALKFWAVCITCVVVLLIFIVAGQSCKEPSAVEVSTPTPSPVPTETPMERFATIPEAQEQVGMENYGVIPMMELLFRNPPYHDTPNAVRFIGEINGTWLTVRRHKSSSGGEKGWEAALTSLESDYRPVVKKNGAKWEIVFETQNITTEFVP